MDFDLSRSPPPPRLIVTPLTSAPLGILFVVHSPSVFASKRNRNSVFRKSQCPLFPKALLSHGAGAVVHLFWYRGDGIQLSPWRGQTYAFSCGCETNH